MVSSSSLVSYHYLQLIVFFHSKTRCATMPFTHQTPMGKRRYSLDRSTTMYFP